MPSTDKPQTPQKRAAPWTAPPPRTNSILSSCAAYDWKLFRTIAYANFDLPPCKKPINQALARQLLQARQPLQPPKERKQRRKRRSSSAAATPPRDVSNLNALEGERNAEMPSSCKDIRDALAQCLQESDCVMIHRNSPADCLRPPLLDTMPTKCQQLKTGYGQCKRGMVDMRKRFRGNQPIAVSKEKEGVSSDQTVGGGQLYGGRSAFNSGVKETSGNEPEEKDWRELENEKYRKK